ncbi:glucose-methanol-choline oxidoreductase [Setomelanomma holmii]|uniref:Glucose-methanol-choline oxidoreductase n=1 Tax=Setomelanomma holmii TaxID=210430 RepID=A0A9P4HP69_9PLEO|nr:glucose-methanol-choline oxidoreductase [Setomelanomma holmii]
MTSRDLESDVFDFIIVGAGPAGAALSSRLASYLPTHSILLLEAGPPSDSTPQALYDRYTAFRTPGLNYGYQTTPQAALNNQVIDYSRGKGLGGTSLINFAIWNRGARDDYDEWARLVGDEKFAWKNVKPIYDSIENFHNPGYEDAKSKYVRIEDEAHGQEGLVSVEFAQRCEEHLPDLMSGIEEFGWKINRDVNSGDPIGVGFTPATAREGARVTAMTAYLGDVPANLKIRTGVQVARVLFDGKKAVGVESVDGEKIFGSKEVILSAGALDTPKVLLLSGVGPASELQALDIPVVQDLAGVGRNLQDHCHYPISAVLKEGTGPLSYVNNSYVLGFLKDVALYDTDEFRSLAPETKVHLQKGTVPCWELGTGVPKLGPPPPGPPRQYLTSIGVLMNPQSRGVVSLRSADPREPALFDPKVMSHPYDRKVLITAGKRILEFMKTPSIAKTIEGPANMPASESDEDILAFIKQNLKSTWHMSCTCKMGSEEDESAVVNSDFAVKKVQGLRVVDLSVLPALVNAHPVGAGYLMGEMVARVFAALYQV